MRLRLLVGVAILAALGLAGPARSLVRAPVASAQSGTLTVSAGGPYTGATGTAITFTAQAFLGGTATTSASFQWTFGDGGAATGQTATHAYTTAGTYTVIVTATASGQTVAATSTATVSAGSGQLTVNAGGPYTGQAGSAITFTAVRLMSHDDACRSCGRQPCLRLALPKDRWSDHNPSPRHAAGSRRYR